MSEPIRRLKLFAGAGWRRTWSDEDNTTIVAESDGPGTSISAVARRHGLIASQLFTWRRLMRQAEGHDGGRALQFVPAVMGVTPQEPTSAELNPKRPEDFRKGMDGLAAVVRDVMGADPFSGTVYVFRSKRADQVKLLV